MGEQELQALIKYIEINKAGDLDWFTIKPANKEGTRWEGKCWYIHDLIRYDFDFQVGAGPGCVAAAGVCVGAIHDLVRCMTHVTSRWLW